MGIKFINNISIDTEETILGGLYMKRIMLFIFILIFAALAVSGCSTNNNAGPSASAYGSGTAMPGTARVSNVPKSTEATLNPLISPASTF